MPTISPITIQAEDYIIENIKPMEWYTLRYWVRETAIYNQKKYAKRKRNVKLRRILGMIWPNLKKPIFIVGAPRSGTTFLGSCLAELPEISYYFEPIAIKAATSYVYTKQWSDRKIKNFYPIVYRWLMRQNFDADLRLADKTPRNSLIIPTLYRIFPDAQFIFIQRDGRDAALSLSQKPWYQNEFKGRNVKEPTGYIFGPHARFWVEPERAQEFEETTNIHRCVWIWRQYVEHILAAKPIIPESQFHELRYENLVTNPIDEANRLLDFLNIVRPQSRQIFVDFISSNASPNSIGAWKKGISDPELEQIDREAGGLLHSLGYSS